MKKALVVIALLAAAGGGLAWWKLGAPPGIRTGTGPEAGTDASGAPAALPTVAVEKGSLRVVVEATGRVVPELEVEIKCKASGEVIALPVDVSDPVEKGSLLLQLDPEDEQRSLERAEVTLAVSKARLAQARLNLDIAKRELQTERVRAKAALRSAEARVQETQSKLARVRDLVEKKLTSDEELDVAATADAQAAAALEDARARVEDLATAEVSIEARAEDVRIAEAQVQNDEIALSDAQKRLAETKVVAPIDGIVAVRSVQVGQIIASGINNVGGGTAVMSLVDLSRVYVLVSVDESDIGRIEVGQVASINVDAFPEVRFEGKVVRVATKGVVESNVVTFEAKVEVEGRRRALLKPEMTANVEIVAVERQDVLLLPVNAVGRQKRERYVDLVLADGKSTERRAVKTGASDGEKIEIVEGLEEGDRVVLARGDAGSRWRGGGGEGDAARNAARAQRMQMRMLGGGRR